MVDVCCTHCYSYPTETNNADKIMRNTSEWLSVAQMYIYTKYNDEIYTRLADVEEPTREWDVVMHSVHARLLTEIALPLAGDAEQSVRNAIEMHESASSDDLDAWLDAREHARDYLRKTRRSYPSTSQGRADAISDSTKICAATAAELSTLCVQIDHDREYGPHFTSSTMLVIEQLMSEFMRMSDEDLEAAWVKVINIIVEEVAK